MAYRNLQVKTGERGDECGARIAVYQNCIRLFLLQDVFYAVQDIRCDIKKALTVLLGWGRGVLEEKG